MSIGITTYRTVSVLVLIMLVTAVVFASLLRWTEAAVAFAGMIAAVLSQALLLRCHHCGARPGLWLLSISTLFLNYEVYIADALFLAHCPRCQKSLSDEKTPST
jgi:hypothetical protein